MNLSLIHWIERQIAPFILLIQIHLFPPEAKNRNEIPPGCQENATKHPPAHLTHEKDLLDLKDEPVQYPTGILKKHAIM
jgi:hypothetical protein